MSKGRCWYMLIHVDTCWYMLVATYWLLLSAMPTENNMMSNTPMFTFSFSWNSEIQYYTYVG